MRSFRWVIGQNLLPVAQVAARSANQALSRLKTGVQRQTNTQGAQ